MAYSHGVTVQETVSEGVTGVPVQVCDQVREGVIVRG